MTQLYVLSQSGDSAVNLGRFEYVYVGDDNKIKAVCGQRVIRLGDYDSRDSAKYALSMMLYYAGKNPGAGWYQTLPEAARLPSTKKVARCGMLFAARFPTAASADCWRSRALSWTENARTARRKAGRPPIMLSRW